MFAGNDTLAQQQVQKQRRNRCLERSLLERGQTQVALELELKEIIQKADKAIAKAQTQHIENGIVLHCGDIHKQSHDQTQHEHQAAHHRGAGLVVVPDRAFLTDGLTGLQCPQHGNQKIADHTGKHATAQSCNDYS